MKKSILLCVFLFSLSFAQDYWRVLGPLNSDHKSSTSPPPFRKWHKTSMTYKCYNIPGDLDYLLDDAFDEWSNQSGYLSFTENDNYNIRFESMTGDNVFFKEKHNNF